MIASDGAVLSTAETSKIIVNNTDTINNSKQYRENSLALSREKEM